MKSPLEDPRQTRGLGSSVFRVMPDYVDIHIARQLSPAKSRAGLAACRQAHGEAASSLRVVCDVACVPACNLPHQRQAEPGALGTACSRNPVKRRKQPFARFFGADRSAIRHIEESLTVLASDRHLDGRLAMELRIFDEVADHSTKQHRVPAYQD